MIIKRSTTTLVALVLVGLLGACGGDDDDGASSSGTDGEILEWTECMRDQGVEISDPVNTPEGGQSLGDPGNVSEEDMQAAQHVCGPPPGLGAQDLNGEDQEAFEAAALEFAECMRNEGIEDFPDPDFSDSGPGGEANSEGDETVGSSPLAPFGEINLEDPDVAAAFEACQDLLDLPDGASGDSSDAGRSGT
jgi:hypothetical protein